MDGESVLPSETGFWLIGDPDLLVVYVAHKHMAVVWWVGHGY